MTVRVVMDGAWADHVTIECDGCGAGATAYGALVDADDLTREAAGHASAVGVAECPVVPGTHWCGGCDDLRRDAAAEAVPF